MQYKGKRVQFPYKSSFLVGRVKEELTDEECIKTAKIRAMLSESDGREREPFEPGMLNIVPDGWGFYGTAFVHRDQVKVLEDDYNVGDES